MVYQDRLYGKIIIKEPVILEIIKSESFQRLKGVDQAGYFEPYFPGTKHSRFEHSLGVYILLHKFGASLKEQVAGLIHDLSHATFSHCIDYALDEGSPKNHDHQDKIFKGFVKETEVPNIFKKYSLDPDFILNEENFPLKEKKLPDLCADRLDYSLRTAFVLKEINHQNIDYFLSNLTTMNNQWVFKNFPAAKNYAQLFYKLNKNYYAGFYSALMFQTVGDLLRYSLKRGYLNQNDLYQTDRLVLRKIKKYLNIDKYLKILWLRMNYKIKVKNDPNNFDRQIFVKSRIVDPLFKKKDQVYRLSLVYPEWKKVITKESKPKEYFLKFEN